MHTSLIVFAFMALAAGLVYFLVANDKGEKEPRWALWLMLVFGAIAALAASILELALLNTHSLKPDSPSGPLFLNSLGVGIIEESLKFLPAAIFLYKRPFFNEHTDGVIYFAIVGLGFGLPENILYTLNFGSSVGLSRLIMTPFLHASLTGSLGYLLAKIKVEKRKLWLIIPGLSGVALVHGFYDFGLSSTSNALHIVSVAITLGLTIGMFLLFMRANDRDREQGLAAVGHNSFCRSCGTPNPDHHLYCTKCGMRA